MTDQTEQAAGERPDAIIERRLRRVNEGVSACTGQTFFNRLVEHLSASLDLPLAFVAQFGDERRRSARTLAFMLDARLVENVTYDLVGTPCEQIIDGERAFPRGVQERFPNDPFLRHLAIDGYVGTLLRDASGQPRGLLGVMARRPLNEREVEQAMLLLDFFADRATGEIDRTEAEAALRTSESRFRALVEASPIPVGLSRGGNYLYVNDAYRRLYGHSPRADLRDYPLLRDVAPESRADVADRNRRRELDEAAESDFEAMTMRTDGSRFPVHIRAGRIQLADGPATIAFITDITERRRAVEALREAEERYRTLFARSPQGVVVIDPSTGRLIDFNEAAHRTLGYTREEYAALGLAELDAMMAPEQIRATIDHVLREGGAEFETKLRARSGELRDTRVNVQRLELNGQTILHSIAQDVTEQNRLREQLLQSQKMEAVGVLAGGVAHDFNNLLAVISGYSESLVRRLGPDHPLANHAQEIQRAAERGSGLVRQLLAFSRHQRVEPAVVDLSKVVTSVQNLLRRVMPPEILIETVELEEGAVVEADPGQLEQILMNLALNARDAMPHGGALSFSCNRLRLDHDSAGTSALANGSLGAGEYVRLSVADTGTGIDEATRRRIFEPFFTTKGLKGTGLGLSIVYGIVQQYGGQILIHSEPGCGARFEIVLPAARR